jgi:hypothetical protein
MKTPTKDFLIEQYVRLRDEVTAKDREFKEWKAGKEALMEGIAKKLQTMMDAEGESSINTPHGSAYKTYKDSATVADWDQFFSWVLAEERFEYLDHRVSKKPVKELVEEGQPPPPGVNYTKLEVVQVRRPK